MIKKILLRFLSIIMWGYATVCLLALLMVMFNDDNFTFIHFIIFCFVIGLFAFLGIFLWKKSNKWNNKIQLNLKESKSKQNANCHTKQQATTSFVKVQSEFINEIPKEVLNDMRSYYHLMQAEGDIRVLSESVELLKNTKNIDTFISRYELAQRLTLTLEQAKLAGIKLPSKFTSFKELSKMKYDLVPKLLDESYIRVKNDALKLKTEKGQLNRFQKFYDFLVENDIFFDEFEEYNEIIDSLKRDIDKYTSKLGG